MVYSRKLVTPPEAEPVTLAEAKLHCRVDHDGEDTLISSLIVAARVHIEQACSRALVTQTWDMWLPMFPYRNYVQLPLGTVQSVGAFAWTDTAETTTSWTVDGANLKDGTTVKAHVEAEDPDYARIVLAYGQSWPTATLKTSNPVRVRFTAGYGDASAVPQSIKQALLLLVGHWYENREAVTVGNTAAAVSEPLKLAVDALLASHRIF